MAPVLDQGLSWGVRVVGTSARNAFAACLCHLLLPSLCLQSWVLVLVLLSAAAGNEHLPAPPPSAKLGKAAPLVSTAFIPPFLCAQGAQASPWLRGLPGEAACLLASPAVWLFAWVWLCAFRFSEQWVITAWVKNLGAEGEITLVPTAGRACVPVELSKRGLSKG